MTLATASPRPALDALVVGAGLTGLVAALRLRLAGLQVHVIDAAAQAGGVIGSVQHQGCLFERGPNSALASGPLAALIQVLGLQDRLCWASAASNKRYVWHDGAIVALPASAMGFLTTPLFSARAKLGLLAEPFRRAADPAVEESIAAFVRRRLGPEFLDVAVDPFVSGVYAGDPAQISVAAAFPRLYALEQRWGSLSGGALRSAHERRRSGQARRPPMRSFSFDGGMQVLTDALAARVGGVATHTRALALQRDAQGLFTVQALQNDQPVAWQARAVILAVPSFASAALLRPWAPHAAAALDGIAYAPVACVASAYAADDVAHPLDGFGCLLPSRAQRQVLGVLFSSRMFAGRTPQGSSGTVLLSAFMGGQRRPDLPALPDAQIAAIAHAEQSDLLGVRAPPLWQQVTRWPQAIPQYNLGHLGRVAAARTAEQTLPGLRLCGSWADGVSVGDCVANGDALGLAEAARLRA